MNFKDTLQTIVNLSTEQKLKMAVESYVELLPVLKSIDSDNSGAGLVCAIIGTTVGADGKITVEERAFVQALFKAHGVNLSDSDVDKLVKKHSGDQWRTLITKLAGVLNAEAKARLALLCASICAIDDTISREESRFLADIFSA